MNDTIERLFYTVSSGNVVEVRQYFMHNGVSVNVELRGQNLLHESRSPDIATYLIGKGANVNQKNFIGRTPLHKASSSGYIGVVNTLIGNGANVNTADVHGWTPLHLASEQGQVEVILALLKNNADVNAVDLRGQTPLHMMFGQERDVATDILLRNNASVNAKDICGMTPLHVAVRLSDNVEVIKVLLRHNADVHVADNFGITPLDVASLPGNNISKYILNNNPYKNMYVQTKNQSGLALIVNYSDNRPGSDEDVKKMTYFFEHTLGYDVRVKLDAQKNSLMKFFESIKNNEMKCGADNYHCFVLVMMCHGDQDTFQICDGYVQVRDIVDQFKHSDFPGKPKHFIFQSCRKTPLKPETRNASQQTDSFNIGESSEKKTLKLHTDSDRLVSFATTSGHYAYRSPSPTFKPWIGAYFVHALLNEFSKNYKTLHVVEMLQNVRLNLNEEDLFKEEGVTCQMSEDQSTLTRSFFL